jgi:hypothetical protein
MLTEIFAGLLPPLADWITLLVFGVATAYTIGLGGWVLARAGRSPLWVLLLLVPYANLLALWLFAYVRWPAFERRVEPPAPPSA